LPSDPKALCGSELKVSLELHSGYETDSVEIAGKTIPLEDDRSAPLAYALNDSFIWKLGSQQFFSYEQKVPSKIYFTQPYAPQKIPVIFVHGTFSSPVWWAPMWNSLEADPVLGKHCQFWNYIYNSGSPVILSAANLRKEIQRKVDQLDPAGTNQMLRKMVVIGHSQGGLLTKCTAVDTGDKLWNLSFPAPFGSTAFQSPEDEQLMHDSLFFTPLPSVKRVVFISTPHRGSYLAGSLVRSLARRFMSFPEESLRLTEKMLSMNQKEVAASDIKKHVPTSLDGMSPKNKTLLTLSEIPVADGISSHSIIAVKGKGSPEKGGDGVVKFTSAKIDGVESEFIVRSGHSCQERPEVIEEVRRILLEHLHVNGGRP
jgi:pimeloyl-ACP methyl ester carboxylesterase